MSKNQKASGITNIISYDNSGNISFVSGSTTLMSVSSSGAVTLTNTMSGGVATSASLSANSNLLEGTGSVGFATTASLLAVSSSQQQISASLLILTASYTALSSSYIALSGSYNTFSGSASTRITANSSSIQQVSSSQQQISASLLNVVANYATTGSNSFRANQSITGSLVVSSTITAQTLVVQTVTSSILYSSGSNLFGSALGDRQTFTGSLNVTGSSHAIFGNVGIGIASPAEKIHVFGSSAATSPRILIQSHDTANATAGLTLYGRDVSNVNKVSEIVTSGSDLTISVNSSERMRINSSGNVGIGTTQPSYALDVSGTARVTGNLAVSGNGAAINLSSGFGYIYTYGRYGGLNSGSILFNNGTGANLSLNETATNIFTFGNGQPGSAPTNSTLVLNTSAGSVGIGTSSPGSILHVKGGTAGGADFGAELRVFENTFGAVLQGSTYGTTEAFLGNFRYNFNAPASSVTNYLSAGHGILFYDGVHIFASAPGGTSGGTFTPSERMTITNSGNALIGTTTDSGYAKLQVLGTNNESGAKIDTIEIQSYSVNNSWVGENFYYNSDFKRRVAGYATALYFDGASFELRMAGTGAANSSISWLYVIKADSGNGYVYNYQNTTAWQQTSDIRIKENINPLSNALNTILQLNPVTFDYKDNYVIKQKWNSDKKVNNIGFIAQEFENIFPKFTHSKEEKIGEETISDFKAIDTGHLVPILVKAIQELKAENDSLKSRVEVLETK